MAQLNTWEVVYDYLLDMVATHDAPSSEYRPPQQNDFLHMSPIQLRQRVDAASYPSCHQSQDQNQPSNNKFNQDTPSQAPQQPHTSLCPRVWIQLIERPLVATPTVLPVVGGKVRSIALKNVFVAWWKGDHLIRGVPMCDTTGLGITRLTSLPFSGSYGSNFPKIWIQIVSPLACLGHAVFRSKSD